MWPVERWGGTLSIVAVSGGADSIALLHALTRISESSSPSRLIVAHVNHGTRGESSDADAEFVKAHAQKLSLPFYLGSRSSTDPSPTGNSESSLREFRYRHLREAAQAHGARYLVTGHTLDDQIETVLFRIFRGTGLRGLTGIPAFRKLGDQLTLVRPMLSVTRGETQAYVHAIGQTYRTDASNEDSKYTRNFLRNELLPLARKRFPDIDHAIARLCQSVQDQQSEIPELVTAARGFIDANLSDQKLTINCQKIACYPGSVIVDALIETWAKMDWPRGDVNRSTWLQLAQLVRSDDTSQTQPLNLPGNLRAKREGGSLTVKRCGD
jgi:tRNA(Ile)-lysidine synthase